MIEPLPSCQLSIPVPPVLKNEKDFIRSLESCHELAVQEAKVKDLRFQLFNDLLAKVVQHEKSKERSKMLTSFAEEMKAAEESHARYIEQFMGIYPNSDKMENDVSIDQERIKRVEDKLKEAKVHYDKFCNNTNLSARDSLASNYETALNIFKQTQDNTSNELKKAYLERMESMVVRFRMKIAFI